MNEINRILFALPDKPDFLTESEVADLTGYELQKKQIDWFTMNKWEYAVNAKGRIMISRLYAHMKMSGMSPTSFFGIKKQVEPNLSHLKKAS